MNDYTPPRTRTTYPMWRGHSDHSGHRASLRLWRPLIIIGACIVAGLIVLVVGYLNGGIR